MKIDDAVGEIGAMTVLGLADGELTAGSPFAAELSDALLAPLPTGDLRLETRIASLVDYTVTKILPEFRRVILASPELVIIDALVAAGCSLPVIVVLPPWTPSDAHERIRANLPSALDGTVLTMPTYPPGDVAAADTVLLACGFDAGPGMWSLPTGARAVLDFYRSQFLYEAVLLDPLGVPVHRRATLFSVVSAKLIDRAVRFTPALIDAMQSES